MHVYYNYENIILIIHNRRSNYRTSRTTVMITLCIC